MGVAELYKTFPEQTSSHGVPHIKRVQGGCGRLLWTLLTLTGLSLAIVITIQLVDKYNHHDVDIIVKRKPSAFLPFPAVTVCNVNPLRLLFCFFHIHTHDVTSNDATNQKSGTKKKITV